MHVKQNVLVMWLFFISVVSCDPVVTYNFDIVNKSNKRLKVITSFNGKDSLIYLDKGNSFLVFRWDAINMPGDDYFDDNIFVLDDIKIFVNDSVKLNHDFKSRSRWRLQWENSYTGTYRLTVTDKELSY